MVLGIRRGCRVHRGRQCRVRERHAGSGRARARRRRARGAGDPDGAAVGRVGRSAFPRHADDPRGRRLGRRAPPGDHGQRHERGGRCDHDRARLPRDAVRCAERVDGTGRDRGLPRRRRSRPLPRHPARQRRSGGRLQQPVLGRRMDGAGVVRGPLRRAPRRRLRAPVSRVRAGADRRVGRPGQPDRHALHGRRQRRLRGRELRGSCRDRRRLGVQQPARRRVHAAAAGRRGGQRLRGDAQLRRRPRGAPADVRAVAHRVSHARARVRRRELGDARGVRRRAPRLRDAADRRLLPAQQDLHGRDVPHHRRRPAGVHQLAERAPGRSADGALPVGVRVQRQRREARGTGRPDGQGTRAPGELHLDQPHLGSPGHERDVVRDRVRGAEQEQPIRCRRWLRRVRRRRIW